MSFLNFSDKDEAVWFINIVNTTYKDWGCEAREKDWEKTSPSKMEKTNLPKKS